MGGYKLRCHMSGVEKVWPPARAFSRILSPRILQARCTAFAGSLLTKLESARTEQSVISQECSHAQSRIADRYHPDPGRDDLDGIEPAGQAIYCERRTSDPACSTSRCNHRCDATALFGNVCSGILSGTNRPTPDCAARRRLHHAG